MSDSEKTKEQLIEELKALRGQGDASTGARAGNSAAGIGLTRRDVLAGWVAPVILTVPLIPRSGMAAAEGSGNNTGADFTAFPTKLNIQADDPAGAPSTTSTAPSFSPTIPTFDPTLAPTSSPTNSPTRPPTVPQTPSTMVTTMPPTPVTTMPPTPQPTTSPTITIPVELTDFEVNA